MERIQFLNIGYGNVVSANRVIAIISPDSCLLYTSDAADEL